MTVKPLVKVTAIVGITVLSAIALWQGLNGVLLALSIGAIAAIGGSELPSLFRR